ncbi:Phosphatidylcholine:ceramide cholinephosphotransferase 3, partial [Aphelenchoides avenae]
MAVQRVSPAANREINNAVGPTEEEEDDSNFAPTRLYQSCCCRLMNAHEGTSSRTPINRACRDRTSSSYAVPFLGGMSSNTLYGKGYSPCSSSSMGADIPLELHKLLFTFSYLLIAAFSNWISLAYIHDVAGRDPLPDALFSILPEQSWALEVGDLMVTFCAISAIAVCLLHRYRAVVLRRMLFIAAVLYTLRTLTLLATQLPSGYSDNETRCRERLNATDRTLKVYVLRTLEQTIHIGFQ